jgi:hypothetical protein
MAPLSEHFRIPPSRIVGWKKYPWKKLSPNFKKNLAIVAPLPEHFQIPPSRIPGPQSLGKKEICREGWDLGFIYPNETSPSLGEKASFQ